MTEDLIETFESGVVTLTMNRPEARNALTGAMLEALLAAAQRAAADPSVRVLVLTGAGGAFCAGGDVKGFAAAADARDAQGAAAAAAPTFEQRTQSLRASTELSRLLHEMPKPTLAVIPGAAAGAGLSLALACDLRIAAKEAKLTTAFSRVGLSGDYGGSYFLTRLVGGGRARELYFTADVITGEEAAALGIVNEAVPVAELAAAAATWRERLARLPTIAIGYMKRNLNVALAGTLSDVLDAEAIHMVRTMATEDHKAASRAFVEKRPPEFAGR
ncbi:enoyl-CoA hydratase-related protein [Parvibaculum sp.]|jgi:2-(1,2-epoxy-1,2-dihydrophenyl)acetyl-CoA isomerase|uniref:enoyl-CoA hydratase-related protein n=1 Tax=Alphaproteobacteria TaxID=28211 RepID=UPI001AFDBD9A|nr:enoyl-CoA hydratase-related protein [Parvibaculum sp.]MBO6691374.1 enoyl-CoA hydratase/isomerase family protein [Parvibaculum sp.]MBO6715314.1 enoyl-CoA hydratase/isomerase family protein [Parvibaculum sp.]MCK5910972.1 enoyl-CoA hydratase/isomerase family protein [Caulobacter sp.]